MPEQIGQIREIDLNEINEKLRAIQRLFDEIFETYGNSFSTNDNNTLIRKGTDMYVETYDDWGY